MVATITSGKSRSASEALSAYHGRKTLEAEIRIGKENEKSAWSSHRDEARQLTAERQRLETEADRLRRSESRLWKKCEESAIRTVANGERPRTAEMQWVDFRQANAFELQPMKSAGSLYAQMCRREVRPLPSPISAPVRDGVASLHRVAPL